MALRAMQRYENVFASIRQYVKDNLVTTESLTVDLDEALDIDYDGVSEWVELRVQRRPTTFRARHMESADRGEISEVAIELHTFVKKVGAGAASFNTWRSLELVDIIDQYFHHGTSIPIYERHSGGTPATQAGTVKILRSDVQNLGETTRGEVSGKLLWRMYEAILKWDRPLA